MKEDYLKKITQLASKRIQASKAIRGLEDVILEAEVSASKKIDFIEQYKSMSGESPVGNKYFKVIDKNKWGIEFRLYFNADEAKLKDLQRTGAEVRKTPSRKAEVAQGRQYVVGNNELMWQLIGIGLRLGPNDVV